MRVSTFIDGDIRLPKVGRERQADLVAAFRLSLIDATVIILRAVVRVIQNQMEAQAREQAKLQGGHNALMGQKQRRQQVQDAKYNMYMHKVKGAQSVKSQL